MAHLLVRHKTRVSRLPTNSVEKEREVWGDARVELGAVVRRSGIVL